MKVFHYQKNVSTLKLNEDVCTGCGRCAEVFPHQVFMMEKYKARIIDFDACMECGACTRNCPSEAICVDSGVACATGIINEWLKKRNSRGEGGSCCS